MFGFGKKKKSTDARATKIAHDLYAQSARFAHRANRIAEMADTVDDQQTLNALYLQYRAAVDTSREFQAMADRVECELIGALSLASEPTPKGA